MRHAAFALAAVLVYPATADAQIVFGGGPDFRTLRQRNVNVELRGQVTVAFHGDPAAGCSLRGLCQVSGTTTWNPAGEAGLQVVDYVAHRRRGVLAVLSFGDEDGSTVSTVVKRGPPDATPGTCADSRASEFDAVFLDSKPGGRTVPVALWVKGFEYLDLMRTRCAGPLDGDVGRHLPVVRVTRRSLLRRGTTVDLSGSRPFSAHGLTGTVRSTVVLRLLGGKRERGSAPPADIFVRRRIRTLEVSYRITRVSGQVTSTVAGLADPALCAPLDSCGLTGSVSIAPAIRNGSFDVYARALASVEPVRLRRAAGLVPGPSSGRVSVYGFALWSGPGKTTASLSRAGAGSCSDDAPMRFGGLGAQFGRTQTRVDLSLGGADPLRTRCPGPLGEDVITARQSLVAATVPLSAFRKRRIVLRFSRARSWRSDGYEGRIEPDVVVELSRGRIRERVRTEPTFRDDPTL